MPPALTRELIIDMMEFWKDEESSLRIRYRRLLDALDTEKACSADLDARLADETQRKLDAEKRVNEMRDRYFAAQEQVDELEEAVGKLTEKLDTEQDKRVLEREVLLLAVQRAGGCPHCKSPGSSGDQLAVTTIQYVGV